MSDETPFFGADRTVPPSEEDLARYTSELGAAEQAQKEIRERPFRFRRSLLGDVGGKLFAELLEQR